MSHFPWARFTGLTIAFTGFGYLLMKTTVPTEEELYNRMAPDIRKKVDAARALRLAREAEMKAQVDAQNTASSAPLNNTVDPDSIKPIWANSKK